MLNVAVVFVAALAGAYLAFAPRLARSKSWSATLTPLASIMGSGFLVSAPLLGGIVGTYALLCMAALLVIAFAVGGAIRFNILNFEPIENRGHGPAQSIALASRVVLAGAYFISVSYYLQLLAAFALKTLGIESALAANLITSSLLATICGIGIWRGLAELGALEKYAVSLNLGMILALLVALASHNVALLRTGSWALPDVDSTIDLQDMRVLLGLLIVVQGFETSRYLGDQFPAETRVRTMRSAQLIAAGIYLVFVALCTVLFREGLGSDVTAIIDLTRPVASVLPLLLAAAAIGSQFSAGVADAEGAGGLIEDLSRKRLPMRYAYILILLVTLALTWGTNVNGIIAYASRAFALYYALQCAVAAIVAGQKKAAARATWFGALAAVCLAVFALGLPSD